MIPHDHSIVPSNEDKQFLQLIRYDVDNFINGCSEKYDEYNTILLDIGPDIYKGAKQFFKKSIVKVLDIKPLPNVDYVADLCQTNTHIPNESFDYILCTNVLEHTLQPFRAIEEIHRMLKKNGILFLSVPLNFRIHGPLPDCWRFTKYGVSALLNGLFEIIEMNELESGRPLMPLHYTVIASSIILGTSCSLINK